MNIAEILKYCPRDYRLYSPLFGEVTFYNITETKIRVYNLNKYCIYDFNHDGTFNVVKGVESTRECMLFPSKDQRDWSKFRLPTKPGDIMMMVDGSCPFIFKDYECIDGENQLNICVDYYCGINEDNKLKIKSYRDIYSRWTSKFIIPASEEAKKRLFDKMAEAGYKWNADTLELEKIEPKFKEGDVVIDNQGNLCLVSKIRDDGFMIIVAVLYTCNILSIYTSNPVYRDIQLTTIASTTNKNKLYSALVREGYKYDKEQHLLIKQEFKPFDKVLVRNNTDEEWT